MRARWKIEDLARGQWQMVVTELPPGTSAQKVLEEIEELTNPKVKAGKKALTQEQVQLKQTVLAVLDTVRDESSKDAPVRLVFEPKTRTVEPARARPPRCWRTPAWRPARRSTSRWSAATASRRRRACARCWWSGSTFARPPCSGVRSIGCSKVLDRIHILEGRQLVLLNIDEVIRIIRKSDEPKPALIAKFKLSDRQADDILDICACASWRAWKRSRSSRN